MNKFVYVLLGFCMVFAAPSDDLSAAAAPITAPKLEFEKYQLPNGLEVILVEDHRLPLVAVNLWYHVGPANERPGRTGFAHLFEHMMFQGSKNVPDDAFIAMLEGAGASDLNGTTGFDRTNYFETLPSNQLELALWLESDRMGFLLEKLDQEKLSNQRDVVRNERRQSRENAPYGLVEEALNHQVYPKGHPYHASVIGSHADIEAVRLSDVREFFKQYYGPNNASIAIVGDIDKSKVRALVQKYFGPLQAGPQVPRIDVKTPPITAEKRLTVTDKVELPRVYMAWLTAPIYKPGDAEADLTAEILGGSKASRLYEKLVYEQQIAQDVSVYQQSLMLGSMFNIEATAKPGVTPEALEKAINIELAAFRDKGPTQAEVDRARNTIVAQVVRGLETLGGFGGVADRLNQYNHFLGDPGYLARDLERYQDATPAALRKFAAGDLTDNKRVVVYGVPGEKTVVDVPRTVNEPAATPPATTAADWRAQPPGAAAASTLALPQPQRFMLPNGLAVYLLEQHKLPVVAANLIVLGGSDQNPAAKPGLAGFTADMLDEGTTKLSTLQIAQQLAQLGAQLGTSANNDYASVAVRTIKSTVDDTFALLADVALRPAFDARELERVRNSRLTQYLQQRDNPGVISGRVLTKALYGPRHPYGFPELGTPEALEAISRDDLAGFWKSSFAPGNAALIVSGDLSVAELRTLAEKHFAAWQGKATKVALPAPPASAERRLLVVDRGAAPQTALRIGAVGVSRSSADYVPIEVMNTTLGGLFSSRINMNLREKNGYTYGASSAFAFRRGPGPFQVGTNVRTDVTAPAVKEIFNELERMRAGPVSVEELATAKDSFSRSLPGQFETSAASAATIGELFVYDLPLDYYAQLPARIQSVNAGDVARVAQQYLQPEKMVVVAAGDAGKILPGLEKLKLGKVEAVTLD
ncbi:MAG: pitrilysin family protein [Steroidobacteraceae bacterium]